MEKASCKNCDKFEAVGRRVILRSTGRSCIPQSSGDRWPGRVAGLEPVRWGARCKPNISGWTCGRRCTADWTSPPSPTFPPTTGVCRRPKGRSCGCCPPSFKAPKLRYFVDSSTVILRGVYSNEKAQNVWCKIICVPQVVLGTVDRSECRQITGTPGERIFCLLRTWNCETLFVAIAQFVADPRTCWL